MDEYEQIQRLRELWSRSIMTWSQLMIPLGAAIVALFIAQGHRTAGAGGPWDFQLLLIGWALFSLVMLCWRLIVHDIDAQIVALYPRMLELKREVDARYFYNHLTKRAKKYLWGKLLKQTGKPPDYEKFMDALHAKERQDRYELLLKVWKKHGRCSVDSRGHGLQDSAVLLVASGLLAAVLWSRVQAWGILGLFLLGIQFGGFWPLRMVGRLLGRMGTVLS